MIDDFLSIDEMKIPNENSTSKISLILILISQILLIKSQNVR